MGRLLICAAVFLACVSSASAQTQVQFNYRTTAIGCQRITDIVAVEVLVTPGKVIAEVKGPTVPRIETLSAKDWNNGVQFTDGAGRMWRLAYGPALTGNPAQLNGTLTDTADGRALFLTGDGTLFLRVEK